jgi:hypothetical protein
MIILKGKHVEEPTALKTYVRNPPKPRLYKYVLLEKKLHMSLWIAIFWQIGDWSGFGSLIKWGWVACDNIQKEEGHKFCRSAYWKTELARGGQQWGRPAV